MYATALPVSISNNFMQSLHLLRLIPAPHRWVLRQSASGRISSHSLTPCPHTLHPYLLAFGKWVVSIALVPILSCNFSVCLFFSPTPLFSPSLSLSVISIHCGTVPWILSGPLAFSSSPAKLKWFLLANRAKNCCFPLWFVEEVNRRLTDRWPLQKLLLFFNLYIRKLLECYSGRGDSHLCCCAERKADSKKPRSVLRSSGCFVKTIKTSEEQDYSRQFFQFEQSPPDYERELKNPVSNWLVLSHCSVCGSFRENWENSTLP